MQERRLLSYLSKDDIPSSATEPSVGQTFNVVYLPMCKELTLAIITQPEFNTAIYIPLFLSANTVSNLINARTAKSGATIAIRNTMISMSKTVADGSKPTYIYFRPVYCYYSGATNTNPNIYYTYNEMLGYVKVIFSLELTINSISGSGDIYIDTE